MARRDMKAYEARARIIKALAHPSRLLMLDLLQEGERCVCELTAQVGADQSTVSRHLAVLRNAGLVSDRREGVMVWYRLNITCLGGFFNCVETVLKTHIKAQAACLVS